ncbi:hypothetical protein [Phascolarctobacterium faecium]|uniref:hypothetical protein n=1 Tax=Phascolarctobacterium faecium TaxID=33025 RepID=UPI00204BB562|nr:MAG TPA: hypothetical protein [Caudoviricetes sp.]
MKRTEQEQRVKVLTECIKSLEELKETDESVIVITDSFICTSMMNVEGKTDKENIQEHLSTALTLIATYLDRMAKKTHLPLTALLMPVLIGIAKEEGIKVGEFSAEEFSKEILEALEKREQILN